MLRVCPVCGRNLLAWFIPLDDAPRILGIPRKKLAWLIKQRKAVMRYRLKGRHSVEELLDFTSLPEIPARVHETIPHLKEST